MNVEHISTRLKKKLKILLLEEGALSSNWIDNSYNGLNIESRQLYVTEYNKIENKLNNMPHKNYFDIITINGYAAEAMQNFEINKIKKLKLSCDTFVIDMSSEYPHKSYVERWDKLLKNSNIKYKKKKIIGPCDDYPHINEDWDCFSYPLHGFRFFCGEFNPQFHPSGGIIKGLKWTGKPKKKLFFCINATMRPHRIALVHNLLKSLICKRIGYITSNVDEWHQNIKNDIYKIKVPDLNIDDEECINVVSTGDYSYLSNNKFPRTISIDNFKRFNNYIKFHENTGVNIIQQRFHFQPFFSENSYVAVITESQPEVYGFIEKSHAPFMGLQFPIIFGFKDSISYFKSFGFDMFEDIIDHSYDKVPLEIPPFLISYNEKSKMIVKELERLSKLDMHKIYLDCKDRFLYNQELFFDYVVTNNKRPEKLAKWIFGDEAEVKRVDSATTITF